MNPFFHPFCRLACVLSLLIPVLVLPASAEEKKEIGGLVRNTIMVPLLDKRTHEIIKNLPVVVDLNLKTDEAKNFVTDRMVTLQDLYLQATYGKVYTDVGYDTLTRLLLGAVDILVDGNYKGDYSLNIKVNARSQ